MSEPPSIRPRDGVYRALVAGNAFDVAFEEGRLLLGGEPAEYDFVPLGGGYFTLLLDGRSLPVLVEPVPGGGLRVTVAGHGMEVTVMDERALLLERFGFEAAGAVATRELRAPMPGLVVTVLVAPGQKVQAGEGLLVLEAMKMENELKAPAEAVVRAVHARKGTAVGKNDLLVEFEA